MSEQKLRPPKEVFGAKRVNVVESEWMPGWWVGYGKDESCQSEGEWAHWAILAAKILRDPATEVVAPNLYRPDLELTRQQEQNYTDISDGGAFNDDGAFNWENEDA